MSMFYCHRCDRLIDSDWTPCAEDDSKQGKEQFWLMCEEHLGDCSSCGYSFYAHDTRHPVDDGSFWCDGCADKATHA